MSPAQRVSGDGDTRQITARRSIALVGSLAIVSAIVAPMGAGYLWPLFFLPLLLATVFFYEIGGLIVAIWLANFFVLYYDFGPPATTEDVRRAITGTAVLLVCGLLFGRVQRRSHAIQRELAASTFIDRLTGLHNYGMFIDALHSEVTKVDRYGGVLCLLMLDFDRFKEFNDEHGHETGNELLHNFGVEVRKLVRTADLAARYGGEEFTVLIRGDERQGFELAERLRQLVEDLAVEVHGKRVSTTVSIGIVAYPNAGVSEAELIEAADAALYESKRRGRNCSTIFVRSTVVPAASGEDELPASLSA